MATKNSDTIVKNKTNNFEKEGEKTMKEIKIVSIAERTTSDGRKFYVYRAVMKNGKLIDVRFGKEVTNLPTEKCIIVVPKDKCNVATSYEYPRLYVHEIVEIKPYVAQSNIDEYFD